MHTCIHGYMHTCMHTQTYTDIHPSIHRSIHPSIRTYVHTYIVIMMSYCFLHLRFPLHFIFESLEPSAVTVGVFSFKLIHMRCSTRWVSSWANDMISTARFERRELRYLWCLDVWRLSTNVDTVCTVGYCWWILGGHTFARREQVWNRDLNVLFLRNHAKQWCWCAVLWFLSKESRS